MRLIDAKVTVQDRSVGKYKGYKEVYLIYCIKLDDNDDRGR